MASNKSLSTNSSTETHLERMANHNRPLERLANGFEKQLPLIEKIYLQSTARQFSAEKFHAIRRAAESLLTALNDCTADGLCLRCHGAGCDFCDTNGWINDRTQQAGMTDKHSSPQSPTSAPAD